MGSGMGAIVAEERVVEPEATIRVAEVFRSLQGEGPSLGIPSTFVRLQGCTVGCTWCDTKYSWAAEGGNAIAWQVLLDTVARGREQHIHNVVVTGGEPLEHPDFSRLVRALRRLGLRIEVETSGVVAPAPRLAAAVDQWNVSLKLSHSGVPDARRLDPRAIEGFRAIDGNRVYWKFVVGQAEHVQEVADLVQRFALPRGQVLLMPLTLGPAVEQRSVDELVWHACVAHGYRYTPRAHAAIFGLRRGV
jgi:organic radical activating enzyme